MDLIKSVCDIRPFTLVHHQFIKHNDWCRYEELKKPKEFKNKPIDDSHLSLWFNCHTDFYALTAKDSGQKWEKICERFII